MHGLNGPKMTENLCDGKKSGVRDHKTKAESVDGGISDMAVDWGKSDQTITLMDGEKSDLSRRNFEVSHIADGEKFDQIG